MAEILVTGATGTQGGAVLRALLGAGHHVTALVRDAGSDRARRLEHLGSRLVTGDLADAGSLEGGFARAEIVYAVTTPFAGGPEAEVAQGDALVSAARTVRLPWLILASVASAGRAPVPHFESKARIEAELRGSDLEWTVVAPSYFYENVLVGLGDGVLRLALPRDVRLHQVALDDLGALVVAIVGRRDEHLGRRVEVAADAPTPAQMADAVGVLYEQLPLTEVAATSPDLAAMYAFLASTGYGIDVQAVQREYPEVSWQSFADWGAEAGVEADA